MYIMHFVRLFFCYFFGVFFFVIIIITVYFDLHCPVCIKIKNKNLFFSNLRKFVSDIYERHSKSNISFIFTGTITYLYHRRAEHVFTCKTLFSYVVTPISHELWSYLNNSFCRAPGYMLFALISLQSYCVHITDLVSLTVQQSSVYMKGFKC